MTRTAALAAVDRGLDLVCRRHVDLLRTSSAVCLQRVTTLS